MFLKRILFNCLLFSAFSVAMAQTNDTMQIVREETPIQNSSRDRPVALTDEYAFMGSPNAGWVLVFKFNPTTNTWNQQANIEAPDPHPQHRFGASVAVSGEWLIVGAERFGDQDTGKVYFYKKNQNGWDATPDFVYEGQGPRLGFSVDIEGDRAIAGGYDDDRVGQAVAFALVDGDWQFDGILASGAVDAADRFAYDVAIAGDLAVIGAPNDGFSGNGRAFVFANNGSASWSLDTTLSSTVSSDIFGFGYAVDMENDTVAVSAPKFVLSPNGLPHVQIYDRNDSDWSNPYVLFGQNNSNFGTSLALKENRILVGAPRYRFINGPRSGNAELYTFETGTWHLTERLRVASAINLDEVGRLVSLSQNRILISSPFWRAPDNSLGSAFAYRIVSVDGPFEDSQSTNHDLMTTSFSASGDLAVASAPGYDSPTQTDVGRLIFFRQLNAENWNVLERIEAPADVLGFGKSVALSGHYAVVASSMDNGMRNNTGHLHIYEYNPTPARGASHWSLVYKEKGTHLLDANVAIDGDLILVGMPSDNADIGRVDAYHLSMGSWVPIGSLARTGGASGDRFGSQLALNNARILVSAEGEQGSGMVHTYLRFSLSGSPLLVERPSLVPPAGSTLFGRSISIANGVFAVGAEGEAHLYSWSDLQTPLRSINSNDSAFGRSIAVKSQHTFAVSGHANVSFYHFDEVIRATPGNTTFRLGSPLFFNGDLLMYGDPGFQLDTGAFYTYDNNE